MRVRLGAIGTAWFSGQHNLNHIGLGHLPDPAAYSSLKMGRAGPAREAWAGFQTNESIGIVHTYTGNWRGECLGEQEGWINITCFGTNRLAAQ